MSSKKFLIIGLVLMLVTSGMAAPLSVEIKKLLGSEIGSSVNASSTGSGSVVDKSNALFSIGGTGDGVINPGESIEYDQDVTVFGSGDICPVHVWVKVDDELASKEGVFYPSCGVNNDYSVDFDAPNSIGSYTAEFYAGYWPDHQSSPDWSSKISSDGFTVEYSDSDGDGVVDPNDSCPNTFGEGSDGCPVEQDSDGDGVIDSEDEFPNDPNCVEDGDGDGICDAEDEFPNDAKRAKDSDGDGVANSFDDCVNTKGPEENSGCPFGDRDGDGVKDNVDVAPGNPGSKVSGAPTFVESLVQSFGDLTGISYYSSWMQGMDLLGGV